MKKTLLALSCAFPFVVNAADFTGLNLAVGVSKTSADNSSTDYSQTPSDVFKFDKNDTAFSVIADYGIPVADDFLVLVGASLQNKFEIGNEYAAANNNFSIDADPKYSISIAPAVRINSDAIAYVKVSR